MKYSAALSSEVHKQACEYLIRKDGQEDLCFALWYPSQGRTRFSALVHNLILPLDGERLVHGNASFLPEYFERSLGLALEAEAGLGFMHSHPFPGWQDMSSDDVSAESEHAPATWATTGLPLLGMTIGRDETWSSRLWFRSGPRTYQRTWCQNVRVVGEALSINYNDAIDPPPSSQKELQRTISAWGAETQAKIARIVVGVIGAGSVGNIVAEGLARLGIATILLLDFDRVEKVNLDRLLYATSRDAILRRPKVQVSARELQKHATAKPFRVDALEHGITEEEGYRAALDCDVLFSCVDRPWPRSVLNFIAYAHLIPVIDGGVAIHAMKTGKGIKSADWRAHVATPSRRCLECLGQYDPGHVAMERDGYLDDPRYIEGLPVDHPLRRNENVFPFSLSVASFELLQFLSMVISPQGLPNPGAQIYHFVPAILDIDRRGCNPNCPFPDLAARGDRSGLSVTGRDLFAEKKRHD